MVDMEFIFVIKKKHELLPSDWSRARYLIFRTLQTYSLKKLLPKNKTFTLEVLVSKFLEKSLFANCFLFEGIQLGLMSYKVNGGN